MKVSIPFLPQFKDAMLLGKKTWTSRTKLYGNDYDVFEAFGAVFELHDITQRSLGYVAAFGYLQEGFDSERGFIECWNKLHPRKKFDPEQVVWVHQFRMVKKTAED